MSQPRRLRSHDSEAGTGAGQEHITRAHPQIGLFVKVEGGDPSVGSLAVQVEVSSDEGGPYVPVAKASTADENVLSVDETDFYEIDAGQEYAYYTSYHNAPIEWIRANITENSESLSVTTDLYLSGWTQRGSSFDYLTE